MCLSDIIGGLSNTVTKTQFADFANDKRLGQLALNTTLIFKKCMMNVCNLKNVFKLDILATK